MTANNTTQKGRIFTLDLIRKISERNDRLVSNLEEITSHQKELKTIGPALVRASRSTQKIFLL